MTKLYRKSEIAFAILWIVIYTLGMGTLTTVASGWEERYKHPEV